VKPLFIVVTFLALQNSYPLDIPPVCPVPNTDETSGVDRIASSLNMPDGKACLFSQLNELNIGPMVQNADFCACKEEFSKHSRGIGSLSKERVAEIKGKIQEQAELKTMKSFKSRLYEVQDTAIALDTMIRNRQLSELDAYRVKECTAKRLWDGVEYLRKEKGAECPSLQKRVEYFTSDGFMKPMDAMGDLRNEMIRLTDAVNNNTKFAADHNLPLRAFYSTQINQIPQSEDLDSLYGLAESGVPSHYSLSEYGLRGESQFNVHINENVYQIPMSAESARTNFLKNQKELEPLRRSPILRLLIQSNNGEAQEIAVSVHLLSRTRDQKIEELFDQTLDDNEELDIGYDTREWPQELRNKFATKRLEIEKEAEKKAHEILNSEKTIKLALGLQDEKCKKLLDERTIKKVFCAEIEPPVDVAREIIIPETMKELNPETDTLALSMAASELYCNPFRKHSEFFDSLDLKNTFPSFLEQISTNSSEEFARFNNGVAPILSRYMEDGVLSEEERERMIPELANFLVENGSQDFMGENVVAETDEERALAIASAEQLLRGNVDGELSSMVDRGLAETIRGIIDRPQSGDSEVPIHEQGTVEGLFAESDVGEAGLVSNYALAATEEDRERARVISREIVAAEEEGREVDRTIVDANTFRPRNLTTGEVIPDARTIVVPDAQVISGGITPDPVSTPSPNEIPRTSDRRTVASDTKEPSDAGETVVRNETRRANNRTSTRAGERREVSKPDSIDNSRSDDLRRQLAEAEARVDRRQREIDRAMANGGSPDNDELRETIEDLRRSQDRMRRLANRVNNGGSFRAPPNNSAFASNNPNKPFSNYSNPFTQDGTANRFPSVIEDEERVATAIGPNEKEQKSGAVASGSSKSAKGVGLGKDGGGAVSAAVPGLPNGGLIEGFEKFKIGTCAAPTLFYIFPCFVKKEVFYEFNEIDIDFDEEKEIGKKVNQPKAMVSALGLERKTWIKVSELGLNKETEKDEVLVTTYDWFPPMLEDIDKLNDEAWRNEKISEVLANRWNWLFMREVAQQTRVLEQKVYNKEDFNLLMDERKMDKLIKSTANDLFQNVHDLNVRIAKQNKMKVEKLKRKVASEVK